MQQLLTSLNPDLQQLQEDGYQMEIRGAHLLVHHIPYLNAKLEIKYGALVCDLTLAGPNRVGKPKDHTISFIGEAPHNQDGSVIAIINNSNTRVLAQGITVNHYFSSRPASGRYANYYDKVRTYSEILSSQAKAIDPSVTEKPNRIKAA